MKKLMFVDKGYFFPEIHIVVFTVQSVLLG